MLVQQKEERHSESVAGDSFANADVQRGEPKDGGRQHRAELGQRRQQRQLCADNQRVDHNRGERQQPLDLDAISDERGDQSRQRTEYDIIDSEGAEQVGEDAADKQPRYGCGREKRQDTQRFGDAYLKRAIGDRGDSHGNREIERSNDAGLGHEARRKYLLFHHLIFNGNLNLYPSGPCGPASLVLFMDRMVSNCPTDFLLKPDWRIVAQIMKSCNRKDAALALLF